MKPIYYRLFVAFFLMMPFYSHAEFVMLEDFTLWSNTYETDTIRVYKKDNQPVVNPNSCGDPDSYMVASRLSEDARERIYSSLLAAKMANRTVKIWVSGCERERPAILHVTFD